MTTQTIYVSWTLEPTPEELRRLLVEYLATVGGVQAAPRGEWRAILGPPSGPEYPVMSGTDSGPYGTTRALPAQCFTVGMRVREVAITLTDPWPITVTVAEGFALAAAKEWLGTVDPGR